MLDHKPRRPRNDEHVLLRMVRSLFGAITGGACGFATYWFGMIVLSLPALFNASRQELQALATLPFTELTTWELMLIAVGAVIGFAVARYRWRGVGLMSYVALISMIAGYVVYAVTISIPQVPESERWISYALFIAETGGLSLIVIFSFYSLDAATRKRWVRLPHESPYDPNLRPKVALQVPVFNEDFDVVQQTIAHLVRQDYPADRYRVMVLDDSTDADLRRRLSAYCEEVGAQYVTRPRRTGFKAGAINYATKLLPEDFEFVSIIDADYWVRPDFLRSVVGYFVDPNLAFVQTPQDYRNQDESFLTRQYQRAEGYFYHAIMPSRNEQSAIIFCGTMGIIRRRALEQIGGFAENQICEDAEVSVRFAVNGWDSLYIDKSYGKGLMPAVYEAYKKQFYRWAFGNVKILFTTTWSILRSKMRARQKFDFIISQLHWFDGFFVLAIATILLYLGLGPVVGYDAVSHHQREIILLALVPVALLVDGVVRLHMVLRQSGHTRWRDAIMVQGMWFSIKFTIVIAVTKCLLGFRTPFIRTPKAPGGRLGRFRSLFRSLRLTPIETLFGSSLIAVAALNIFSLRAGVMNLDLVTIASLLLPVWLIMYGLFLLTAPIYAYLSYRTLTPMEFVGVAVGPPQGVDEPAVFKPVTRRKTRKPASTPW